MKEELLSKEDVLFVPNNYYITLLREFSNLTLRKQKSIAYSEVRDELKNIEVVMPSGDIIRNTKLAFKN